MTPYYVIFGLLAALALLDAFDVRRDQRIWLLFGAGVVLALFAALRPPTFADYVPYQIYFESGATDGGVNFEPGYWLMNKVVRVFTGNYLVFFVLLAGLSVGTMLRSYKDYAPYFFIPVLVYFTHAYISRELMQVRAGLAAAICLYSMRHIIAGRFWRFAMWAGLAACMHLAAIVFFLVYPLARSRMGPRTMLALLWGSVIVGLVYPLGGLLKIIPAMDLLSRVQGYQDYADWELGVFSSTSLKQLLICTTGLMFYRRLEARVPGYRVFLMSYFIAACWLVLWNDFAIVAGRMATFFSIAEGVLLGCYVTLVERRSRIFYVLLVILFAWTMLKTHTFDDGFPPYVLNL